MWAICYDYESAGLRDFTSVLWGFGLFLFGLFAIFYDNKSRKKSADDANDGGNYFLYIWATLAMLWTLGVGHSVGSQYTELRAIIQEERFETTEGPITSFERTSDTRKSTEYYDFTVNQRKFRVAIDRLKSCTPELANGRTVRVEHEGNTVLRLWVNAG